MKSADESWYVAERLIRGLVASDHSIEAALLVSGEGLVVSSAVRQGSVKENTIAAMTQGVMESVSKTIYELDKGKVDVVILKTDAGYILIKPISSDVNLVLLASKDARLGKLLMILDKQHPLYAPP